MGRALSGESILSSPSCSFHSNCCCHGFAWQAAGEEEGGPKAPTPTKATAKTSALPPQSWKPQREGWLSSKESLSKGWDHEAGSPPGMGLLPSLACLASSVLPQAALCDLFTCLSLPHCEGLGWGAGDSSLIPTAQHRAWHRSESIQLCKKLSLAPWI